MNILVANDDGIKAEGIRKLASTLGKEGDVYVFAPDRQRSASSHALTIGNNLTITREDFPGVKEAYSGDGTPAACVKRGIVPMEDHCRAFKYDPLKRVPPRPAALDTGKLKDEDFSL